MIRLILLWIITIPVFALAQSESAIEPTGSNVLPADAQAVLDHHNTARAEVNTPPLTWSQNLAAFAQSWADSLANFNNCQIMHRTGEVPYGENIFIASSAAIFKAIDASNAWYSEKDKYTYSKMGEANWTETSHYTQMIWGTTTEVGAGIATCPSGAVIVVANYDPRGNILGRYPY